MATVPRRQEILEEAGLSHVVSEAAEGPANASNTVFTVSKKPISDANYDDATDQNDVTVYVNGTPVTVSSINPVTGAITLQSAPANNAVVTVDYRYSSVTQAAVDQARTEAEDVAELAFADFEQIPLPTFRKIVRVYAAGLLLTRDYGFNVDTELTSKDGFKKIAMAEAWLEKYKAMGDAQATASSELQFAVSSDPELFDYYDSESSRYASTDDTFMRDLGVQED